MQDGNVGLDGVQARYDTELANDYGNLASRTIAMICPLLRGFVPAAAIDPLTRRRVRRAGRVGGAAVRRFEVTQALDLIWQRVRRLNRYVEEQTALGARPRPRAGRRLETGAGVAVRGPAGDDGELAAVHARSAERCTRAGGT